MNTDNREIILGGSKGNPQPTNNIPSEFVETDFKIPTELIDLPSGGIVYPNRQNKVEIKYLTSSADNILYSSDLIKSGKVLDVLLKENVVEGGTDVDDMVSGDRNKIILALRISGIGSEYKPGKMKCPSCGEIHDPIVDLEKFENRGWGETPDASGEFEVTLPVTKKKIKFRCLTGQDEKYLSAVSKKPAIGGAKNKVNYDKGITERYVRQIQEVDGVRDKGYIKKFINVMPMKDSAFFREYSRKIEPGIDTKADITCEYCGHEYKEEIVLNPIKLFYPEAETD